MNINIVILQGTVANDPSPAGEKGQKFILKNTIGFGDYTHTSFIGCVAFGKIAETVSKYLHKGKKLTVRGELKIKKVEEKYYTDVDVKQIFLEGDGPEPLKEQPKNDRHDQSSDETWPDDVPY